VLAQLALIADIHGNLVALDAALADIARRGVERIVCLGDLALNGPRPRECVARVMALACPVIMGNNDAWLLEAAKPPGVAGPWMQEIEAWNSRQLTSGQRDWVRTLPATLTLDLGHGQTLSCCHGSPRSFYDNLLATTPDATLDEQLAGVEVDIIAAAHTHEPLLRRHAGRTLVNPGSVGSPFDRTLLPGRFKTFPWADYAIVTSTPDEVAIELCRLPLDVTAILDDTRASGVPHAERWCAERYGP
jgi:putative phosphoesterase